MRQEAADGDRAQASPHPAVIPFHAALMALAIPLVAVILLLTVFGAQPIGMPQVLSALAPACLLGSAPAFLAGRLDGALANRGWRGPARLAATPGMAAATGAAILAPLYLTDRIRGAMPLLLPLTLAVAAAIVLGLLMLSARLLHVRRSRTDDRDTTP